MRRNQKMYLSDLRLNEVTALDQELYVLCTCKGVLLVNRIRNFL